MGALKMTLNKTIAALGFAAIAFGATAASADRGDGDRGGYDRDGADRGGYDRDGGRSGRDDSRPQRCDVDHDHRSHEVRYYDYYPADRYSRAGDFRRDGDYRRDGDRHDDRGRGHGRDHDRDRYDDRYGYGGSRIVRSRVYDTRYQARIHLTEEEFNSRRGYYRVCTLEVRGPDRRYVPYSQVQRLADRECSRRSEVRIL